MPVALSAIYLHEDISDPSQKITGDINGKAIQAIRNNSHRYLCKYTGDNEMTICQLDDNNGQNYYDGTTAVLTGAEGDWMMRIPEFWWRFSQEDENTGKYEFATGRCPSGEDWMHWDGNDLIGVSKSQAYGNKLYSRAGTPTGNCSQPSNKQFARARGNGYTLIKRKHSNVLAFLCMGMYGTTDIQSKVGVDPTDTMRNNNQAILIALGMQDTTEPVKNCIATWGLIDPWGGGGELEDNVEVNNGVWNITEDDNQIRQIKCPTSYDYVLNIHGGKYLDIACKSLKGSYDKGFCDFFTGGTSSGARVCRVHNGSSLKGGGLACADAAISSTYTGTSYGSRLAFRGILIEEKDVEKFKSIPITN